MVKAIFETILALNETRTKQHEAFEQLYPSPWNMVLLHFCAVTTRWC